MRCFDPNQNYSFFFLAFWHLLLNVFDIFVYWIRLFDCGCMSAISDFDRIHAKTNQSEMKNKLENFLGFLHRKSTVNRISMEILPWTRWSLVNHSKWWTSWLEFSKLFWKSSEWTFPPPGGRVGLRLEFGGWRVMNWTNGLRVDRRWIERMPKWPAWSISPEGPRDNSLKIEMVICRGLLKAAFSINEMYRKIQHYPIWWFYCRRTTESNFSHRSMVICPFRCWIA